MVDLLDTYQRRFNSSVATPEMIRKVLESSCTVSISERIEIGDIPPIIMDVLAPGGIPNVSRISNFLTDANNCLEAKFSKGEILGMDPQECLDRRGRIRRGRLDNCLGIETE